MEYVHLIISMIDVEAIKALDIKIKGPGLAIAAYFLFRALTSFFSMRLIRTVMSLINALVVIIILSNWGGVIQQLILPAIEQKLEEQRQEQKNPPQNQSTTKPVMPQAPNPKP